LWIERQSILNSQENIECNDPDGVKQEEGDSILGPFLLDRGVDPRQSVQRPLDRSEDRLQHRALASVDPRKVPAQRPHQKADEQREQADLGPADDAHQRVSLSRRCRPIDEPIRPSQQGLIQMTRMLDGRPSLANNAILRMVH
jgi:hypothetical protein